MEHKKAKWSGDASGLNEKTLSLLFDYQRFEHEPELEALLDEIQNVVLAIVSKIIIPLLPFFIASTFCDSATTIAVSLVSLHSCCCTVCSNFPYRSVSDNYILEGCGCYI